MIRSARQGRQAPKATRLSHNHVSHPPSGPASTHSQSKKTKAAADDDGAQLYDYQAHTHSKGGRVSGNQVDDARLTGARPADEDEEEGDELGRIRRIVEGCEAENEDGFGVVASEDDESIDSDEAMGEGDDVRVKIFKSVAPKPKNGRVHFSGAKDSFHSHDSDSEGSEYTSSNASGFIDASTMLDIGAESDGSLSDTDRSSGSSDEDEEEIDLDEDEGDEDEGKLDQLAQIVAIANSSSAQKRKDNLTDGSLDGTNGQAKRRKLLAVQTEPRPEGEVVPGISAAAGPHALSGAVNLEDLLSNLSSKHDLSGLKKSLKPLAAASKSAAAGPLPAPLETRRQEQIEREAAYELTKKEMNKWDETTRAARGLSGKATDGKERFVVPADRLTAGEKDADAMRWNKQFKPMNELENQVLGLVQASQLSSKKLIKEEADLLEAKGLTPEQIRAKAADTKMARELMFRAERKAKRVAKIKSKTFRRIRKKDRERSQAVGENGPIDLELMHELDDIDGGGRVRAKHEKLELERARERASLKHSSQGKWAKKVSGLKGLGSDTNTATIERVRREELLRKKISGQAGSEGSDEQEDESDFDSDLDVDGIKAHALNQLSGLASRCQPASDEQVAPKGLLAMKFMQRAMATKARLADEAEAQLRQQLADEESYDSSASKEENNSGGIRVQGNPGRLVFGPDTCRQALDEESRSNEPSPNEAPPPPSKPPQATRTAGPVRVLAPAALRPSSKLPETKQSGAPAGAADSNPWLQATSSVPGGTISRLKDLAPSSKAKDSPTIVAEKSKLKAEKRKRKSAGGAAAAAEDGQVEIDMTTFLGSERGAVGGGEALLEMEGKTGLVGEGDAVIRRGTTDGQGRSVAEQRELVSRAFADDGVVAQFAEEKQAQVALDAPKEIDVTIPGWGDWVGKGARKARHKKKFTKFVPGVSPSARQDSNLSHVIVSEKKHMKKMAKYQTKSLPYPYTSKSQLDHKMRVPIGPEFTTRKAHRQLVRPEVLGRPGVIVEPVSKPET